jgi:hypothetical protein
MEGQAPSGADSTFAARRAGMRLLESDHQAVAHVETCGPAEGSVNEANVIVPQA